MAITMSASPTPKPSTIRRRKFACISSFLNFLGLLRLLQGDHQGRPYISNQGFGFLCNGVPLQGDHQGQYISLKDKRGRKKTRKLQSGILPERKKKTQGAFDVQITPNGR